MNEFLIRSEKEVMLRFHSPKRDATGWLESYSVSPTTRNFSASIDVENPPYGVSPLQLFQQISVEWRGWKGEKELQAIEGEYGIKASTDALGHITLSVILHPYLGAETWRASMNVVVEAGALCSLAADAELFFGDKDLRSLD